MNYFTEYRTPIIGALTLASDGEALIGCWFDNDRFFGYGAEGARERRDDLPVFEQARAWLDRYFAGEAPDPHKLPLGKGRMSEFQMRVREAMLDVPYGETTTYGEIAKRIEAETGRRQSAQAVGGAVGHNPLCVIVPCHRVMGAKGNLTGFGGGIDTKVALLEHEGAMKDGFKRPKKGTALAGLPNASRMGRGADYAFGDLTDDEMHDVLAARDDSFAGVFFVGVTSTGIYCRPGCRAKLPMKKNCRYFAAAENAEAAGFRACKLCKPERLKAQG